MDDKAVPVARPKVGPHGDQVGVAIRTQVRRLGDNHLTNGGPVPVRGRSRAFASPGAEENFQTPIRGHPVRRGGPFARR